MAVSSVLLYLLLASTLAAVPTQIYNRKLNWRVVGGDDAPDGAHPHQISLHWRGAHGCGGSIVSNEWVITAAHCVFQETPSDLVAVAGINKLSSEGVSHPVLEIHFHEDYQPLDFINDVAILKVEPITFTEKIRPIVTETEDVGDGVDVLLSGWGRLWEGGLYPDALQELKLKTISVEQCQEVWGEKDPVVESEICTLTKDGEGACHGDSGGPLTRTVDGQRRLVGVASWGKPCARGYPDVFSRVSSFVSWFNQKCHNCLNYVH